MLWSGSCNIRIGGSLSKRQTSVENENNASFCSPSSSQRGQPHYPFHPITHSSRGPVATCQVSLSHKFHKLSLESTQLLSRKAAAVRQLVSRQAQGSVRQLLGPDKMADVSVAAVGSRSFLRGRSRYRHSRVTIFARLDQEREDVSSNLTEKVLKEKMVDESGSERATVENDPLGAALREQFDKWDTSKSGYITAECIQHRAARRGEKMSVEEAQAIIAESDIRGDGVIWFVEYKLAMQKAIAAARDDNLDQLRQLFVSIDTNQDGKINVWELQKLSFMLGDRLTIQELNEMIKSADKDDDRQLDFQEFLSLPLDKTRTISSSDWVMDLVISPSGSAPLSEVVLKRAGPFVTSAYGTRPDGSVVHRTGRRMRKQRSKIASYSVAYDASEYKLPILGNVRIANESGSIKWWEGPPSDFNPSWWLAAFFTVGSMLFVEGSIFVVLKPWILRSPDIGWQWKEVKLWGVSWPFMIGSVFFDVGCWLLMVESLNSGYQQRLTLWERAQEADKWEQEQEANKVREKQKERGTPEDEQGATSGLKSMEPAQYAGVERNESSDEMDRRDESVLEKMSRVVDQMRRGEEDSDLRAEMARAVKRGEIEVLRVREGEGGADGTEPASGTSLPVGPAIGGLSVATNGVEDWEDDVQLHGPHILRPKWRWFGAEWERLDFIAGAIFTMGAVSYTGMTAVEFPVFSLDEETKRAFELYPGLLGGICFVVGSYCYCAEFNESWSLLCYRPQRIAWWLNLFNLTGSFGFLLCAVLAFFDLDLELKSLELFVGYLGGSLLFLASSYLMFLEVINPNDVEVDEFEMFG